MGRERGKGKRGGRGGGRKLFVANVEELQMREEQVNEAARARQSRRGESDDEDDGSDVGETADKEVLELNKLREMRLQEKGGDDDEEEEDRKPSGLLGGMETANPNAGKQNKMLKLKDLKNMGDIDTEQTLSRREREALEAAKKKADYERRHAAGQTAEAKADLARLAEIRRRREEAQKKCEAEGRKPGWTENGIDSDSGSDDDSDDEEGNSLKARTAKAAAALADPASLASRKKAAAMAPAEEASSSGGDIPKLSSIEIKKMKPDAIKDALKARGESIQGQKKDLIKRLTDYEAARA